MPMIREYARLAASSVTLIFYCATRAIRNKAFLKSSVIRIYIYIYIYTVVVTVADAIETIHKPPCIFSIVKFLRFTFRLQFSNFSWKYLKMFVHRLRFIFH